VKHLRYFACIDMSGRQEECGGDGLGSAAKDSTFPSKRRVAFVRSDVYNELASTLQHLGKWQMYDQPCTR
jgi:hypothetical protein